VRSAGRYPSPDQIQDIERKRLKIGSRIRDFHITTVRLLGGAVLNAALGSADHLNPDGYISDDLRRPEDRATAPSAAQVENTLLVFPSAVAPGATPSPLLLNLRSRECRLRRAKANDTLSHVRESLSGLSYQYINKVRQSKTTKAHHIAYAGIKLLSKEVSFYQQVYNRNSRALTKLDLDLKRRYPLLRRGDCSVSTAIADVNGRGQSQARLSWVWAAQDGWDPEDQTAQNNLLNNDRLLECKLSASS
jgi:hypothetical protein